MSYWSPMIFHKFYCLKFIFNLNNLIFQIFGKSRFGGPALTPAPQNLTKQPISLKIVPNWPGWTLVNLHIPSSQLLCALYWVIAISKSQGRIPPNLDINCVLENIEMFQELRLWNIFFLLDSWSNSSLGL